MAGLFGDIGGIVNTLSNKDFYSDLATNAGKSLGILDSDYSTTDSKNGEPEKTGRTNDMRGIQQVFRYWNSYHYKYNIDFRCSESDNYFSQGDSEGFRNAIQDVTLYEFQPYHTAELGTLLKKIGVNLNNPDDCAAFAESKGKEIATMIVGAKYFKNQLIDEVSKKPLTYYKKTQISDGLSQYNATLSAFKHGKWLNVYTLPIFNKDLIDKIFYFDKDYNQEWKADEKNALARIANTVVSPIAATENTLIRTPQWTQNGGISSDNFKLKFYLINDLENNGGEKSWTFRNYKFWQSLYSGFLPVAMKSSIMQSPNIYRVVIKNKGNYVWAKVTGKIKPMGKQRILPALNKYLKDKTLNNAIGDDYLWPEAWECTLTITNLMPMSFSTYAAYLMTGNMFENNRVTTKNAKQAGDGGAMLLEGTVNKLAKK